MKLFKILILFFIPIICAVSVKGQVQQSIEKLPEAVNLIYSNYVDTVNTQKLVDQAIISILEKLDPHSVYIPSKNVEQTNEPLVGNFEGVGIQFNILRDSILVVATIPGGPSEAVGIMAGDKIVMIDGNNVASVKITNNDVIKQLRGKKGTVVEVGIHRKGVKKMLDFSITRDKIPLFSVDASYMVNPETGYIKINRFAATTVQEFYEALGKLQAAGMQNLILDLQGNGGGYLNAAFELADAFIGSDQLIVYTKGRATPTQVFKATARGGFEKGKLIVLVNEGSASASEIVSGAIQDLDRGIIIGRRTFGKGLVQKPYRLNDGSQIRLTVAKYYTPSGRSIQRPYNEGKKEYYKEFQKRLNSGQLMSSDSIKLPDSLMYNTLNGRKVYGGGGILPDIFLPLDTTENSDYYSKVIRRGTLNKFVLTYMDKNRKRLESKYTDISSYKSNFNIDEQFMSEFVNFAEKDGVEKNDEQLNISIRPLKTQIKALIGRNLFDSSAYFEVFNEINPAYLKAIEVINSNVFQEMKIAYK